jgi:hypothetical protein
MDDFERGMLGTVSWAGFLWTVLMWSESDTKEVGWFIVIAVLALLLCAVCFFGKG